MLIAQGPSRHLKVDRLLLKTMAKIIAEGASILYQAAEPQLLFANALRTTRSTGLRPALLTGAGAESGAALALELASVSPWVLEWG